MGVEMGVDNQDQGKIESMVDITTTDVDKSKRRFSKAGLTIAPVIMTLTSKPVFAAQGLSNMISGNGSGCQGDTFEGGRSLTDWQIGTSAPFNKLDWLSAVGDPYQNVDVGTAFSGHILPSAAGLKLVKIIKDESSGWEIVLGYLNLKYYLANPVLGTYFLTMNQFWALNDGDTAIWTLPAGVDSFADLIVNNIGSAPGDATGGDCDL